MPNARRIIFSTYVTPTQSVEGEETAIRHTEFQASPNGTLGGSGIATITATQWSDKWTSMEHASLRQWENFTTVNWEDLTSNWKTVGRGEVTISDSNIATLSSDSNALTFMYIKNTGSNTNALVALDGGTNYYIMIPPGGSVNLRGDGTQLLCNEVRVKGNNPVETTIEFIIAK